MTPEELLKKQNKITELQQDLYESITSSVAAYSNHFYFSYTLTKNPVQTDFNFKFFIPDISIERDCKTIRALELKTIGYKMPHNSWAEDMSFFNEQGQINNVYAFLMMNSDNFTVPENLLEAPYNLEPMHLKKNDTGFVAYEKHDAVSLVDFFKEISSSTIIPILEKNSQEWPEILKDYQKKLNQLVNYLETRETQHLTEQQTQGLLELQSHYQKIKLHCDLDKALSSKNARPKMKI